MNAYTMLARFYDSLTGDVPYEKMADYYERVFKGRTKPVVTVLDLACGTGTLTEKLARRGYELIGTDASPEMLAVAAEKMWELPVRPLLLNQAMEDLDLYGTVDAAVCALDSVNYVPPTMLGEAFRRVFTFLEPGGIFVFDVQTPSRLRALDGDIFVDETEDVFCVWRAEFDASLAACRYGMDLFASEGKKWTRSREEHVEYAYETPVLEKLLREAGFSRITVCGDLTGQPPSDGDLRLFITAEKAE